MKIYIPLSVYLVSISVFAQQNPQPAQGSRQGEQYVTARVIQYNRFVMAGSYESDLIVRVDGSGQFLHLVYSPYDFGFDSPPAELSQLLPPSMTADGSLLWTFEVHPPWNFHEQGPCKAAGSEVNGKDNRPTAGSESAFVFVPGAEKVSPPKIDTLACMIIERWSGGDGPEGESPKPVQAAL